MAIIKCPECGHQVSDQAKACPSCGIEIEGMIMKCPECGEIIFKNQEMCPNCHLPLNVSKPVATGTAAIKENATCTQAEPVASRQPAAPLGGSKPEKPNGGKTRTALVVAFVIALVIVFVGIYYVKHTQQQNELDAYENAMGSTEPAVLQNFLDLYTDAPEEHRDSISGRLEALRKVDTEWTDAVVSGSKAAIERYIQMHPTSIHITEAKIKIDSLDWIAASADNTPQAYQKYIDAHDDGMYIDEARSKFEKLDAQKVDAADKQSVSSLFTGYFNSLAANDEDGLTANLANIMTSFLHKSNATKTDVINYMRKQHETPGITHMSYRLNNDWKINKTEVADGEYEYAVSFSVDHKTENADPEKSSFSTYKVDAKVSVDGKIIELNMKKVVQ